MKTNPNGVVLFGKYPPHGLYVWYRNITPLGLLVSCRFAAQGSVCDATLGFVTKSRWDLTEMAMPTVSIEPNELKSLLKSVIAEALDERRDWVREIVEEVLEDVALQHAINEGLQTPMVSREEVFALLDHAK